MQVLDKCILPISRIVEVGGCICKSRKVDMKTKENKEFLHQSRWLCYNYNTVYEETNIIIIIIRMFIV